MCVCVFVFDKIEHFLLVGKLHVKSLSTYYEHVCDRLHAKSSKSDDVRRKLLLVLGVRVKVFGQSGYWPHILYREDTIQHVAAANKFGEFRHIVWTEGGRL